MRIAVGTSDGQVVCEHLARSSRFFVYDIDDKFISDCQERLRGTDACGNHRSFTEILAGCSAVLCGGVGDGAVNALAAAGTKTIVLARPYGVDEAIRAFVTGTLETSDERVCLCGPGH